MKKALTAFLITAAFTVGAVGLHPAQASEPTIMQAKNSDYSKKKKKEFWRLIKTYEPSVKYVGKKQTVSLAMSTCDYLRAGGDLYGLAAMVYEVDAGIAEDSIMAVIAAAPVVLCPDQQWKFE